MTVADLVLPAIHLPGEYLVEVRGRGLDVEGGAKLPHLPCSPAPHAPQNPQALEGELLEDKGCS